MEIMYTLAPVLMAFKGITVLVSSLFCLSFSIFHFICHTCHTFFFGTYFVGISNYILVTGRDCIFFVPSSKKSILPVST